MAISKREQNKLRKDTIRLLNKNDYKLNEYTHAQLIIDVEDKNINGVKTIYERALVLDALTGVRNMKRLEFNKLVKKQLPKKKRTAILVPENSFYSIDLRSSTGAEVQLQPNAYSRMPNIFSNLTEENDLEITVYGSFVRTNSGYKPDLTFTRVVGVEAISISDEIRKNGSMNSYKFKDSLKGFVAAKIKKLCRDSGIGQVTGKLTLIAPLPAEYYSQFLQESVTESNCFFDCIRSQVKKSTSKKLHNYVYPIIDELEKKYLKTGVPFNKNNDELKYIADRLKAYLDITILSKLGNEIWTTRQPDTHNKKKNIMMTLEKLNHVIDFVECTRTMNDKKIEYVDNVTDLYNSSKHTIMYREDETKQIKYLWDETTIYKDIKTKEIDGGKYHINTIFDVEHDKFIADNDLFNNVIYKTDNEELYNFVNSSIHAPSDIFFKTSQPIQVKQNKPVVSKQEPVFFNNITIHSDLDFGIDTDNEPTYEIQQYEPNEDIIQNLNNDKVLDLSDLYCYDKNKMYASFKYHQYYETHKMPASGKFNKYKVINKLNNEEMKKLLTRTGFVQITNIKITNENIKRLGYFMNGCVYPMVMIQFLYDNNFTFDIVEVAINVWKQDIKFSDDCIKNKFYTNIVGIMNIKSEKTKYNIKCSSIEDAKYLKYISRHMTESKSQCTFFNEQFNSLTVEENRSVISNRSHVASYIMAYAMLFVLDKLLIVPTDELAGVRCDCIMLTKERNDLFKVDPLSIPDWKVEEKSGLKEIGRTRYVRYNPYKALKQNELVLTTYKLNMEQINMCSGAAGSGKTTLFLSTKYGEKLDNALVTFPNNELRTKFINENKEDMKDIDTSTYHKAFKIRVNYNDDEDEFVQSTGDKYNYVINDESTMLGLAHFDKMIKMAREEHIILILAGDFDYKTKQLFQMPPIKDVSFLEYKFDKNVYCINLTKNYRQQSDIEYGNFLAKSRGRRNDDILNDVSKSNLFKFDTFDNMINNYDPNTSIILSPYSEGGKKEKARTTYINKVLLEKLDIVNAKYNSNTKYHCKNENIKMTKDEFTSSFKTKQKKPTVPCELFPEVASSPFDPAYALTSHLIQGCEYDENKTIYIINSPYFTDNQLYVLMSRAKTSKQIIFVNI
jgi:hypothetical protein